MRKKYRVKEVFKTLQGEGFHSGRAAVFLRFAGCNLWSGREEDRARGAGGCARWCDTDFLGGDLLGLDGAVERCAAVWGAGERERRVVVTGGEPLLQLDTPLVDALVDAGFLIHLETNGTRRLPGGPIEWVTVSPKAGGALAVGSADELRLAHPQDGLAPGDLDGFAAKHRYLSPIDGENYAENARAVVDYCLAHPEWRVSVQAHKTLGIR